MFRGNRNIGEADRLVRTFYGLALIWTGVFYKDGYNGNVLGISIAILSIYFFMNALTGKCLIFKWFHTHSLSKEECELYGYPEKNHSKRKKHRLTT